MGRYFAKKAFCLSGHKHASKKEAARCDVLHDMQRKGEIDDLVVEPSFKFTVNGSLMKMGNGQAAGYKPDFTYTENGNEVAEDVKASNGFVDRDFPLRSALFRACFPHIELRVIK